MLSASHQHSGLHLHSKHSISCLHTESHSPWHWSKRRLSVFTPCTVNKPGTHIKKQTKKKPSRRGLTYPFGMSESSLFPGSFSVCCLIFSSRPAASAPWYWSTRTLFLKNKKVGVAEMLLAAAVAWETHTERERDGLVRVLWHLRCLEPGSSSLDWACFPGFTLLVSH